MLLEIKKKCGLGTKNQKSPLSDLPTPETTRCKIPLDAMIISSVATSIFRQILGTWQCRFILNHHSRQERNLICIIAFSSIEQSTSKVVSEWDP
mmetsp:Transcript_13214/g.17289  ORF Transcript_13214/g.17289 Transcript_13214/m.17289 type:complete len:94 (-) Transcript_13214:404-685(-)